MTKENFGSINFLVKILLGQIKFLVKINWYQKKFGRKFY